MDSYLLNWSYYFNNFNDTIPPTLTAISDDEAAGTVSILTQPTCDNPNAVVSATANDSYRFDHWSDGSTDNPYTLTVTQTTSVIKAYFVSTNGIGDVDGIGAKVIAANGQIVVDGADGNHDRKEYYQ